VRLNNKALGALLKNSHLRVSNQFGGELKATHAAVKDNASVSSADALVERLNNSTIHATYDVGVSFQARFSGAGLLSLNQLLRLDHRTGELKRYRHACHAAAERAMMLATSHVLSIRTPLPKGLAVTLERSGVKPFDNDSLVASFKFIIDGFKCAGLISEDDPSHITSFPTLKQNFGAGIQPSIGIIFSVGPVIRNSFK